MTNKTRYQAVRSIEPERNGFVCLKCGARYPTAPAVPLRTGCSNQVPHYKELVENVRAYQAGGEFRLLLHVSTRYEMSQMHESVMAIKLPDIPAPT